MASRVAAELCPICKRGHLVWRSQEIAFSQQTDKGIVSCRVAIEAAVCDACGFTTWQDGVEKLLDEAVRREYDKLP